MEWWRRVLLVAPCYRPHAQQSATPGASPEMICEAIIDRRIELLQMTSSGTALVEKEKVEEAVLAANTFFRALDQIKQLT